MRREHHAGTTRGWNPICESRMAALNRGISHPNRPTTTHETHSCKASMPRLGAGYPWCPGTAGSTRGSAPRTVARHSGDLSFRSTARTSLANPFHASCTPGGGEFDSAQSIYPSSSGIAAEGEPSKPPEGTNPQSAFPCVGIFLSTPGAKQRASIACANLHGKREGLV